jgi:hypothetical protein
MTYFSIEEVRVSTRKRVNKLPTVSRLLIVERGISILESDVRLSRKGHLRRESRFLVTSLLGMTG